MDLDKYQQAWRSTSVQTTVKIDADLLAKAVRESHRGFQSTINWRDCREVGICLLMLPYWFYQGLTTSMPWTWWLSVPALIWVAGFILVDRKRHPQRPSEPGEPLIFYAKEALSQVEHQIWLLRSVFWWYLLPFCMSMVAFFVHCSWISSSSWWGFSLSVAFWSLFILVIYGAVYWVNQHAVRNTLEPRGQDLLKLVASLENESGGEESGDVVDLASAFVDPARSGAFSWKDWGANWNQIVPSWRVATAIIVPTLIGALCGLAFGLWFRIPEMGPVLFQAVVGAVIPFEIVFFTFLYLSYRRKNQRQLSAAHDPQISPEAGVLREPTGDQQRSHLPKAPALVILVLTVFVGILAILALMSFSMSEGPDSNSPFNANNTLRAPEFRVRENGEEQ